MQRSTKKKIQNTDVLPPRGKKKKTPVAEVAELWDQEHSLWDQSAPIQVAALCYLGSLQSANCLPAQLSKAAPVTQVC